jgi:hypothetical protein
VPIKTCVIENVCTPAVAHDDDDKKVEVLFLFSSFISGDRNRKYHVPLDFLCFFFLNSFFCVNSFFS